MPSGSQIPRIIPAFLASCRGSRAPLSWTAEAVPESDLRSDPLALLGRGELRRVNDVAGVRRRLRVVPRVDDDRAGGEDEGREDRIRRSADGLRPQRQPHGPHAGHKQRHAGNGDVPSRKKCHETPVKSTNGWKNGLGRDQLQGSHSSDAGGWYTPGGSGKDLQSITNPRRCCCPTRVSAPSPC